MELESMMGSDSSYLKFIDVSVSVSCWFICVKILIIILITKDLKDRLEKKLV